jgi:RNA polymerase sigma factor (sigma-70 family)
MSIHRNKLQPEDQEMIALLIKKDKSVITLLYERYAGALYGVICNLISNEEVAKETLQDVFIKIWNNGDKYEPAKGRLFTWMVQLTRNVAIDTLRSSQFKKNNRTETLPNSVYNSATLSEEQKTQDPALRRIVNRLDEQNRRIIELLYFSDYTQKEVSEELDIPLGTVKSKVRKAISQLRELLGDEKLLVLGGINFLDILTQHFGH